jgi:hypothetical protein
MFNWLRRAFAQLGPRVVGLSEHDFYHQHEASRHRTLHESRQDGDLRF